MTPGRGPGTAELGERERAALVAIADALVGGEGSVPPPSALPEYGAWLDRALAARADSREAVIAAALRLADGGAEERRAALRGMAATDPDGFHALSSILAGAYLLCPTVSEAIGYPGQERAPAAFDEAAEQLATGILDPVIERGPIYRLP